MHAGRKYKLVKKVYLAFASKINEKSFCLFISHLIQFTYTQGHLSKRN